MQTFEHNCNTVFLWCFSVTQYLKVMQYKKWCINRFSLLDLFSAVLVINCHNNVFVSDRICEIHSVKLQFSGFWLTGVVAVAILSNHCVCVSLSVCIYLKSRLSLFNYCTWKLWFELSTVYYSHNAILLWYYLTWDRKESEECKWKKSIWKGVLNLNL